MRKRTAILRIESPLTKHGWTAACLDTVRGIEDVGIDRDERSLTVSFDPVRISVAEIVRCLEDSGLRVEELDPDRHEPPESR